MPRTIDSAVTQAPRVMHRIEDQITRAKEKLAKLEQERLGIKERDRA